MELTAEEIRGALAALLRRPEWQQSPRLSRFLRFIVERTLSGESSSLKETVVGMEVFDRDPSYDPKVDPVVRVEARRLRLKLQEYYSGSGAQDSVRFLLPKGGYQPQFERSGSSVEEVQAAAPVRRTAGARYPVMAGAFVAVAIPLGLWFMGGSARPIGPASNSTPRLLTGYQGNNRTPAISPDGQWAVYSRNFVIRAAHLYLQRLPDGEARPFTTGENFDLEPAWSPDGREIAFLRQAERGRFAMMIRPVSGEEGERKVCDVALRSPIDWTLDGKSVIAADRDDAASPFALFRIEVADGRKSQITSPPKGTPGDSTPRVSPDGKSIAFVRLVEASVQDIYVTSFSGGDLRRISHENNVVEGFAWDASGSQVIASLQRGGELRSLWRVYLDGRVSERIAEAGIGPISPAVSRRGGELAYVTKFSDTNLWSGRVAAGGLTDVRVLTHSLQLDTTPQISPDGQRIAWRSASSGTNEVWIARADGSATRRLTHMGGPTTGSAHWSPDGRKLVFDSRPNKNGDLFVVSVDGGTPAALTSDSSNEVLPSFSHDGRWIYFSTDRNGLWEIWRMTAEGKQPARMAGGGAFNAQESPDGRFLYYTRQGGAESGIWRIPVNGGAEEKLGVELSSNFWGQWAVTDRSVFFAVFPPAGNRRAISRLDLATGKVADVFKLEKMPVQFDSGMSVAADESAIYWAQLDQAGSDVFLVTGFR